MSILAGRWRSGRLLVPTPLPSLVRETVCVRAAGQDLPERASSTRARGAREQPAGGGRETGVVNRRAQLRAEPREPTEPALRSQISHRQAAGFGRLLGPSSLPSAGRAPLELWPALPAAPRTRASSEAGMAGRGGRRRMPLRRRRG